MSDKKIKKERLTLPLRKPDVQLEFLDQTLPSMANNFMTSTLYPDNLLFAHSDSKKCHEEAQFELAENWKPQPEERDSLQVEPLKPETERPLENEMPPVIASQAAEPKEPIETG